MRRIAKAKRDEFNATIAGAMLALGASYDGRDWCVETQSCGLLKVALDHHQCVMYTVFCRFDDPDKAIAAGVIGVAKISGKWNFHLDGTGDPQAKAAYPIEQIANVVRLEKDWATDLSALPLKELRCRQKILRAQMVAATHGKTPSQIDGAAVKRMQTYELALQTAVDRVAFPSAVASSRSRAKTFSPLES